MGDYRRETTPNIARFAAHENGTSFPKAFSHGIFTKPSAGSILTGTYPSHHGLGFHNDTIPPQLPTIAELLSESGYTTAAVSEMGNVSSATELDRGFDRFAGPERYISLRDKFKGVIAHPRAVYHQLRLYAENPTEFLASIREEDFAMQKMGSLLNTQILSNWIRELQAGSTPYFAYSHFLGPHTPYVPPPGFLRVFADGVSMSLEDAVALSRRVFANRDAIYEMNANRCPLSDKEWNALEMLYDAEIRYADYFIGQLLQSLQRTGLDDTIVVVTADHGELFGERGVYTHKLLLDDGIVHVPRVVYNGHLLIDCDHEYVQHLDIIKTFLSKAGVDTDHLHGINLNEETRDEAFFQRRDYTKAFEEYRSRNPDFDENRFHRYQTDGIRTDEYKYTRSDDKERLLLFPDEETNVIEDNSEVAEDLAERLSERKERVGPRLESDESASFSEELEEQLEHLGYR